MRWLLITCALALFTSCGMVRDAQEAVADIKAGVAELKTQLAEAASAADTDKSGDTSLPEWLAWLAAGGGGALLLTLRRLFGAVAEQDAKRSAAAKELHGRVNEVLTMLPPKP